MKSNLFSLKQITKLLLISLFLIISSCSNNDDDSQEEIYIIEGGTILTSQIVEIDIANLPNDTYEGKIGEIDVALGKGNEDTLVFVVTPDIPLGEISLSIPSINLQINYVVQQTVLNNTVEQTMQTFLDELDIVSENISEEEQGDFALEMITSFNSYYQSLSDNEKQVAAEFYQTNQDLLQSALDGDFSRLNNDTITRFSQCKTGIYLTGILGVVTVVLPNAGVAGIFSIITGAATAVTFVKTLTHCSAVAVSKIKSIYLKAENEFISESRAQNSENISFIDNTSKSISLQFGNRAIQQSDESDTNTFISEFFTMMDDLNNQIVVNLNNAINFYNDYAPSFFALDLVSGVTINEENPIEDIEMNEITYNNISLIVSNSNIEIQNQTYINGGIQLTLNILDTSNIPEDGINTNLNFSYQDNFNEFNGSFPININIEGIDLSGIWTIDDATCMDGPIEFSFNGDGTLNIITQDIDSEYLTPTYQLTGNNLTIHTTYTDDDNCGENIPIQVSGSINLSAVYDSSLDTFNGTVSDNWTLIPSCEGESSGSCQNNTIISRN